MSLKVAVRIEKAGKPVITLLDNLGYEDTPESRKAAATSAIAMWKFASTRFREKRVAEGQTLYSPDWETATVIDTVFRREEIETR